MKHKKTFIGLGVILVMLIGTGVTLFLTSQNQQISSNAQVAQNNNSCQAPDTVSGVQITYPNCQGGAQCDFTTATCTWDAVSGAVNYEYTITEVDNGSSVSNNSVVAPTATVTFPVTAGKTYKCDVSAVNSCGAQGGTGTDTQLCQVAAVVTSPTISPSPEISEVPPPPPPETTIVPTQTVLACGQTSCGATNSCESGLVCVQASDGQSYCAQAAYANACQQSPNTNSCCFAPAVVVTQPPPPKPPVTGSDEGTILIGAGSLIMLITGGILVIL